MYHLNYQSHLKKFQVTRTVMLLPSASLRDAFPAPGGTLPNYKITKLLPKSYVLFYQQKLIFIKAPQSVIIIIKTCYFNIYLSMLL